MFSYLHHITSSNGKDEIVETGVDIFFELSFFLNKSGMKEQKIVHDCYYSIELQLIGATGTLLLSTYRHLWCLLCKLAADCSGGLVIFLIIHSHLLLAILG